MNYMLHPSDGGHLHHFRFLLKWKPFKCKTSSRSGNVISGVTKFQTVLSTRWHHIFEVIEVRILYRHNHERFCFFKIFIYLSVLGLSCGTWHLVPWPEMEPRPPALAAQSLSHWTTREFPAMKFWFPLIQIFLDISLSIYHYFFHSLVT